MKRVWALASCRNEWIKHASLALLGGFVCVCGPPIRWLVRSFVPCSVSLVSGWRYRLGEFAWTCAFFTAIVFISSAYPAECTSLRVNEFCWLSDKKLKTKKDFLSFFFSWKIPTPSPHGAKFLFDFGQTVFCQLISPQSFTWVLLLLHLALYRILLWYKQSFLALSFYACPPFSARFAIDRRWPTITWEFVTYNAVLHTLVVHTHKKERVKLFGAHHSVDYIECIQLQSTG